MLEPRFARCVEQVVGPQVVTGHGARDVEHPTRRNPFGAPPQIAPRDAEQLARRTGQGGEQLAVLFVDSPARSGSSPPAASRSWSGSSESSWVGAGTRPSARPRTTTRSRSSPTPMLHRADQNTPRPSAPPGRGPPRARARASGRRHRARPVSSISSRQASRSSARSTVSGARCSTSGQWRSGPARLRADSRGAVGPPCPLGQVRCRRGRW